VAVIVLQLALSLGVYISYGPWYSALSLVFLTAALTSWYGAFEYRLDSEGVTVRGPLGAAHHGWDEFAGFEATAQEVRLRFRAPRRPPELVLYAPHGRERVLEYVAEHIPAAEGGIRSADE